jgi:hypothetical protein
MFDYKDYEGVVSNLDDKNVRKKHYFVEKKLDGKSTPQGFLIPENVHEVDITLNPKRDLILKSIKDIRKKMFLEV